VPWSDYPTEVRQFSSLVQSAALARFGSAATVELISNAAKDAGVPLRFQSYSAIAKLYGEFATMRESSNTLGSTLQTVQRTGLDQSITADMIARPPWAPTFRDLSLSPFVLVKGTYSMETPEGPVSGYFSHRYNLADVHTINQVMGDMQLQMEQGAGGTNLDGATLDSIVGIEWSTP
jgi:hypothetical protein